MARGSWACRGCGRRTWAPAGGQGDGERNGSHTDQGGTAGSLGVCRHPRGERRADDRCLHPAAPGRLAPWRSRSHRRGRPIDGPDIACHRGDREQGPASSGGLQSCRRDAGWPERGDHRKPGRGHHEDGCPCHPPRGIRDGVSCRSTLERGLECRRRARQDRKDTYGARGCGCDDQRLRIGGGRRHHLATEPADVETIWPGCWPRWVFEEIGLFDPEMVRNQDDELNQRIRDAGGGFGLIRRSRQAT